MPRPEQTPAAQYEGLPYGTNAMLNEQADVFQDETPDDTTPDEQQYIPRSEEEQFLFSPTDRPNEPITAGMSFGAGPNMPAVSLQSETDEQFANRVVTTLESEGESTAGLNKFLARVKRGI